ncbi:MAG: multidrug ABC transporter permease [Bdellovibrionales bacterium RIFOXYD12_FULL_39_22]|nr:MAG: multidrug ABC transporter permease [Bdellovibrionales bacterium RIFOXYB1_FULL_39_21]OFZ41998.1 MAG: multidrug ABC transporter permease [Bdellovibrionales bacterium RIFOXYC12_FULL_39_17]OFZ50714.1 MAG: multidrug ABC transporter permease [Bdellovibrionales bacterium RIFOXYC1_FULL_39_130]OFZ77937.1 MAG: multidrug ABC transporter permease [Bdellovibrionales bacterium RIFOXYD1_FULL_39_84]OFZ93627.1 MAG: multidrug ABC transporter permease [Bdellovibrionales bacterium RIFOXYD12_FULL_39_22]HLE
MKISRAFAIAEKEVFHVMRDPFTLAMALLLPMMMVMIFGFAIEFNVKNIHLALYDGDKTAASRKVAETLASSHYFIISPTDSPQKAIAQIFAEKDRAALIINRNFEYNLFAGQGAHAQLVLDGSDNSTVGSIIGYFSTIQKLSYEKITKEKIPYMINLKTRFLYNPELNSRWFIVPGLMVVVIAVLSTLLTSLTIAREYENGSMELLLSTPIRPIEIILGKLAPYVILGFGSVTFVYIMARGFFEVPFRGSHLVFYGGCFIFLTTCLAQGLLISTTIRKQQMSMQVAMTTALLPSILLSGFIFPVESMPLFFRILTAILPARWFMEVSRDVFLKGSGVYELRYSFFVLSVICILMVVASIKKFKRDVEA